MASRQRKSGAELVATKDENETELVDDGELDPGEVLQRLAQVFEKKIEAEAAVAREQHVASVKIEAERAAANVKIAAEQVKVEAERNKTKRTAMILWTLIGALLIGLVAVGLLKSQPDNVVKALEALATLGGVAYGVYNLGKNKGRSETSQQPPEGR